jgi:glutathione synthase
MRFVFVMDTLDKVSPEKDTTFGFLESAHARGHRCDHCLIHEVDHIDDVASAVVHQLDVRPDGLSLSGIPERVKLTEVDAVFVRKDPPFDQAYSYATLLLESLRGQTLVLNDPRGLREANEKLYTLNFEPWMPRTIVTSDRTAIHEFTEEVGGKAVIKPLDGMGGWGVMAVRTGDANARAIVDMLTLEGQRLAMVQAFIPEVSEGDKRVLVLDGEPLGAILRVPAKGDLRANIHVGGDVVPTELTARERELVAAVAPSLRADGLYFVGLDLIGEHLTEVNVTSPTGIRELSRFTGQRQSDRVIEWVEKHAGDLPKTGP